MKALSLSNRMLVESGFIPESMKRDGGPGSGNFGHAGVHGQVGGSAKSGEGKIPSTGTSKCKQPEDFDSYVKDNGLTVIYRGFSAPDESTMENYANSIKNGDAPLSGKGRSALGVGLYFTEDKLEAEGYVTRRQGENGDNFGRVCTAALDKGAKIADQNTINSLYHQKTEEAGNFLHKAFADDTPEGDRRKYGNMCNELNNMDIATYAATKGYDALRDYSGVTVIINQDMLIVRNDGDIGFQDMSKYTSAHRAYETWRKARLIERFRKASDVEEKARLGAALYSLMRKEIISRENSKSLDNGNKTGTIDVGIHLSEDGGPGSGNFNHRGVPGQVGGSARAGSSSSEATEKFKSELKKQKEAVLSSDASDQALHLYKAGYLNKDNALAAMNDGSITEHVNDYFSILEENGNTASDKPLSDNTNSINSDVNSGKYVDYESARAGHVKEMAPTLSDDECKQISNELYDWSCANYRTADADLLDKYIENDHTYEGEIYRGYKFFNQGEYDKFMSNISVGGVIREENRNASWSNDKSVALRYSYKGEDSIDSVVIKCTKNRTSVPISYNSAHGSSEMEVLSHSKAQWTVIGVNTKQKGLGRGRFTEITVIEKGNYNG